MNCHGLLQRIKKLRHVDVIEFRDKLNCDRNTETVILDRVRKFWSRRLRLISCCLTVSLFSLCFLGLTSELCFFKRPILLYLPVLFFSPLLAKASASCLSCLSRFSFFSASSCISFLSKASASFPSCIRPVFHAHEAPYVPPRKAFPSSLRSQPPVCFSSLTPQT